MGRERELELLGKCIQRVLKNQIASTNQQTAESNSHAGEQLESPCVKKSSLPWNSFIKARRSAVESAESTMRRQSELIVLIQRWSSAAAEGSTAAESKALLECASCIAVSRSSCSRASNCSRSSFRCVFETSCDTGLLARLASKPIPKRPNTYENIHVRTSNCTMYPDYIYCRVQNYIYQGNKSRRHINYSNPKNQISNQIQKIRKDISLEEENHVNGM